jgi:hypothetical protein
LNNVSDFPETSKLGLNNISGLQKVSKLHLNNVSDFPETSKLGLNNVSGL